MPNRKKDTVTGKTPEIVEKLKSLGFTDKEIESPKALHKFRVTHLYPIVYLAAKTGMRRSELLALKWKDIDFKNRVIKVYSSSHYGKIEEGDEKRGHHENSTKEGKPKAYIEITQKDVDFLKQHKKNQIEERLRYRGTYVDNDLVFARPNGTPIRNDVVSKEFSKFARSNGFSVTFHGLRHTHCTILIAAGVPTMYVAMRVGHQRTSTTDDLYGHAKKTLCPNLANVFEKVLADNKTFEHEKMVMSYKKATEILDEIFD